MKNLSLIFQNFW